MKTVKVRLQDALLAEIDARAGTESTSRSEVIRDLLAKAIAQDAVAKSQAQIASTLETVLKPHVERLAALAAKSAVAAGTAEWLQVYELAVAKADYKTAHTEARKKAVAQLRLRAPDDQEDEE